MIRILLLDCSSGLTERLKAQGFEVESGTIGFSTGVKWLPSQVYEHEIIIYSPIAAIKENGRYIDERVIKNYSPEYHLKPLQDHILNGATLLIFVNPVAEEPDGQNAAYGWIPFMPLLSFTKDKLIDSNSFEKWPDFEFKYLAPVVNAAEIDLPVLRKIEKPPILNFPHLTFGLFWNAHHEALGLFMKVGDGRLIILPRFKSNEEIVETFIHRVVPEIYNLKTRVGLVDNYISPAEQKWKEEIERIETVNSRNVELLSRTRVDLATAKREKVNIISKDTAAKQILSYYDTALKQGNVALFYLYKIIELIENRYGGEAAGIKSLGFAAEWKSVKKTANVSYGDMRHAPKPGDVIMKWSNADIKACFEATEKIVFAYFATLFPFPTDKSKDKA